MGQRGTVAVLLTGLAVLVLLPVVLGTPGAQRSDDARTLVIVTPHNEQIRSEFATAFEAWHAQQYDEPVTVAWSVPGGTSEIRALLESQWLASLDRGETPGGFADLVFGGGSYEHSRLRDGVTLRLPDLTMAQVDARVRPLLGDAADALLEQVRSGATASVSNRHVAITVTPDGERFDVALGASVSVPAVLFI